MERCIAEVWEVPEVLRIREGGSVPGIRMLEKVFGANAVHVPLGQASDNGPSSFSFLRICVISGRLKTYRWFFGWGNSSFG